MSLMQQFQQSSTGAKAAIIVLMLSAAAILMCACGAAAWFLLLAPGSGSDIAAPPAAGSRAPACPPPSLTSTGVQPDRPRRATMRAPNSLPRAAMPSCTSTIGAARGGEWSSPSLANFNHYIKMFVDGLSKVEAQATRELFMDHVLALELAESVDVMEE
mgnify:CR=1 FL=1